MPKALKTTLRVLSAVMACIFLFIAFFMFAVKYGFLNRDRYVESVLTKDYYAAVDKSRDDKLAELGSVIEVEQAVLDKYASKEATRKLSADYVRAVFSDLLKGTEKATDLGFSSTALLDTLKAEFASYDFSDSPYKTADKAAEKAYDMICAKINDAAMFVPGSVMSVLDDISGLVALVKTAAGLWYVFLLFALALLAFAVFYGDGLIKGVFASAAAFWCAALMIFVPVLILYFNSTPEGLELEQSTLYYFLSGCINAVRGWALGYASIIFGVATVCFVVVGIKAAAPRAWDGTDHDQNQPEIIL